MQLSGESVPEFFISLEVARIARLEAKLLSALRVVSVVKRQLEYLRDIEVSCEDVRLVAPASRLDAAGRTSLARVQEGLARVQELLNYLIGIVECRLAPSFSGYLTGSLQESVRSLFADLHV